ncbi:MAG: N-acetylmuramoyl-L-alanine amidase [Pseudomonadota bacterium]|nr:N-acetylmuramoyl-L-alanine amidase [Pseudomonadota bacterium]
MTIDADGMLRDPRVTASRSLTIEHGTMAAVLGIIVHQTNSSTAVSTLNSYKNAGANGAHFLIDKDGTIYQTASVYMRTYHVGKLRARCLVELTCTAAEITAYKQWDPSGMHKREMLKSVPDRYPGNGESVGIELVGRALPDARNKDVLDYESVTAEQNASLKWLVAEISRLLAVPMTEVFRHPVVSFKTDSEAQSAVWK